ncbi:MAG: tRNA (N(6)-L-threonylcarbamoyladenosine(37)-C(2))-methylthiotransferase MtaB [Bacteroidales bacterium]|nr:tRNA (N(6)-L-threonylcarbamoyladenosine(37)-C(2))-methylthiotransferase MtaB [Bacteroidales bacterium]
MTKVAFKTLGCRLNLYETDALASQFREKGFETDDDFENSDAPIFVINTCTITNQSDKKSREYINRAVRKGSLIVVTGCMAEQYAKKYFPGDSNIIVVDNKHKNRITDIVEAHLDGEFSEVENYDGDVFGFEPAKETFHTRSIVKIQDGCNNFCSYCIVPYVRGRAVSRPVDDILNNVKAEIKFGFKEIVLTGVNISKYKYQDVDFEQLVKLILDIEGDFRLRIASIEPDDFSETFIDLFRNPKLAPQIHLCLQSGSNDVLKKMYRHYKREDFLDIVDKFRKLIPDFNFTTDIIVGFPGETDDNFAETLDAAQRIGFGHIHVFKYSRRAGTKADKMENQIDERIKNKRSKILRDLAEKLSEDYMQSLVGKTQILLTETIENDGFVYGYGENYARIKIKKSDDVKANEFYTVKIERVEDGCLLGVRI